MALGIRAPSRVEPQSQGRTESRTSRGSFLCLKSTTRPMISRTLRVLLRSSPAHLYYRRSTMIAHDLDKARAKLAEDMKIDILSLTQEDENVKARHEVSRTFVCKSCILLSRVPLSEVSAADTITGWHFQTYFRSHFSSLILMRIEQSLHPKCLCMHSKHRWGTISTRSLQHSYCKSTWLD